MCINGNDCRTHVEGSSNSIAFSPDRALFHGFEWSGDELTGKVLRAKSSFGPANRLPGHSQTPLEQDSLLSFLQDDVTTPVLDRFRPWLWLVAKQDSSHVSSLTHQVVRGRDIILTENPELHLVWHENRIFIKPLPPCLLSYSFWEACLAEEAGAGNGDATARLSSGQSLIPPHKRGPIRAAVLGFMRSYCFLVQHPSDFSLAVEKGLIPIECLPPENTVSQQPANVGSSDMYPGRAPDRLHLKTYASFMAFIECFGKSRVQDAQVSDRYHFGDLRLSRLNFWAKFALRKFTFQKAYGNYDAYFSRFYGPLLFIFGVSSVLLSALQVGLAAVETDGIGTQWLVFIDVSKWFSVAVLVGSCATCAILVALLLFMGGRETVFALKALVAKNKESARNTGDQIV